MSEAVHVNIQNLRVVIERLPHPGIKNRWVLVVSINFMAEAALTVILESLYGVEQALVNTRYEYLVLPGKAFNDELDRVGAEVLDAIKRYVSYEETAAT